MPPELLSGWVASLLDEVRHRQAKARQDVANVQLVAWREHTDLGRVHIGIDFRLAGINDSYRPNSDLEILLQLLRDFIGRIRAVDDLDGQVGDDGPGPRLRDPPIPRPTVECDERDIRPSLTINVRSKIISWMTRPIEFALM
jgi:hypothetical protein